MEKKLLVWLLVVSLIVGCLGQSKPTPTPSPTPINNPPIADFSYSWTGGDKDQPWTCSKITFKAEVSDPEGDKVSLMWHDNNNALFQFVGKDSFSTKLWPDGLHSIKLTATDEKGAKTIVEKQINVKYEVPEPIPIKTMDGLTVIASYAPMGIEDLPEFSWSMNEVMPPLLGHYDITNPVTVDWHIKWALEHGINTLWIFISPHGMSPTELENTNYFARYYRKGFLEARYKDKIKFNVFLDMNHYNPAASRSYTPSQSLGKDIDALSKYFFIEPNYYKIDGKPVLYLQSTQPYLCDDCEDKREREKLLESHIKLIRETAKKNGYEVFLIGDTQTSFNHYDEFLIENFDAMTSYNLKGSKDLSMWKTDEKGRKILIDTYEKMVVDALEREGELSNLARKNGKFYVPVANPGYNSEKLFETGLYDANGLINRTNPAPDKFEEFVNGVKTLINPTPNMMLISTFNEFEEGSAIEPTREFGFAYLDIIRDNFAIKPPGGWPPNVAPTKNCGCTEYKNWNIEIGIPPFVFGFFGTENELLKILKVRKEEDN